MQEALLENQDQNEQIMMKAENEIQSNLTQKLDEPKTESDGS